MERIWEVGLCFFVYAFLGWCIEVIFHAVRTGKFINRGFLNGPVCPIYGFGAVGVIMALTPIADKWVLLYVASALLASALEWVTGFVLEKVFHAKWWDYSDKPFNLNGYICLRFSLLWGVACVAVMRVVHPVVFGLVSALPNPLNWVIFGMLLALLLLDTVATVVQIRKLSSRLKLLDELGREIHASSDSIGEMLTSTTLATMEKAEVSKEKLTEKKDELTGVLTGKKDELAGMITGKKDELTGMLAGKKDELAGMIADGREAFTRMREQQEERRRAYDKAAVAPRFGVRRILDAFPNLKSNRYQEALEKLREAAVRKR